MERGGCMNCGMPLSEDERVICAVCVQEELFGALDNVPLDGQLVIEGFDL